MKGSGLNASRNSTPCAKAHHKLYDSLTSSAYLKAIISRKCRHFNPLQQATSPRAEKYVHLLLFLPGRSADLIEVPQRPPILHKLTTSSRKRKRGQEEQDAGNRSPAQDRLPLKRLRTKPSSRTAEKEFHPEAVADINENCLDPLQYWIQTGRWRKDYFEQDSQVREDFERGKSPEKFEQLARLREFYAMHGFPHLPHLFARKRSSSFLSHKKSQSSLKTASDQLPREVKSAQYNNQGYEILLEQKGSYMREYDDIDDDNKGENMKTLCNDLLERDQTVPQDSLFCDDMFKKICEKVRNRNEAMVVQDITRLIVPSAENLAIYGAKHLNHLYESVNEGWNSIEEFEGTRPQPDYSVGFGRSAFSQEQLNKLKPFVGAPGSKLLTHFMATMKMYFPFLTCEVKCGAAALDIADRQNAHSMTVAVRALVDIFRLVKREKELDREILAFSVSHDHASVRIYGHYPVIERDKTTFYRHPIRQFYFTDGEEKWTTYKFTKNVYDTWMPILHKRICSAIDDLPLVIDFDLSKSASFSQSGLLSSQQSSLVGSEEVTPTTSLTQVTEPAFKKPRNKRAGGQQR